MAAIVISPQGRDPMFWLTRGALGGLIAGVVFLLFQMFAAVATTGPRGALRPLRMVAAIMFGRVALDPSYSTLTAGMGGAIVHLFLATLFGSIFGAMLLVAVQLDVVMRGRTIVLAASVYGLMLWLINFYGFAPLAGLSWFPDTTSPSVQFVAHTFCYGAVLGLYIKRTITPGRAPRPIGRPTSRRGAG